MFARAHARQRLVQLFQRTAVADLRTLQRVLGTPSRTTVFRVLCALGYRTSCSHAGRFYTLEDIPQFDDDGLWRHGDVLFSQDRTLRETLVRLVKSAPAGWTHAELGERLRLRVHDTLRDLTQAHQIDRVPIDGVFVYVGVAASVAKAQLAARAATRPRPAAASSVVVLEVLLEIIDAAGAWRAPAVLSRRLQARGVPVSAAQVAVIYREHGIVKKGRYSRSRHSPP